ncbi:hypothetical protein QFZ20_003097 [Flavobacterium sp. W4I14]|nr:hypothetical protein [Flavobacterium sp. W4I14]
MRKFFLAILTCVMVACSASKSLMDMDNGIKKISIGMSKKKVISILGNDYEVISSKERTSTLGYKNPNHGIYRLVFVDDRLNEWSKDRLGYYRQHRN